MYIISHNQYASLIDKFLNLYHRDIDLGDDDLSIIGFQYEGKTSYIVLVGKREDLMIQVFADATHLNAFKETLEERLEDGKCDTMYRFDFVQIEMTEPENLYDEEYNEYVKAKINVEEEVPMFRSFKSGHTVWVIDEAEARLVSAGLDVVIELANRGSLPHQTFCTMVDGELVESYFFEQSQLMTNDIEVSSNTPKLSFRRRGRWLIGTYYTPMPTRLNEQMRPIHDMICIILDEDTEEVVHFIEPDPGKNHYVSFNEKLYRYMQESKKRPRSVAFYGVNDYEAFVNLFQHLDVEIYDSANYDFLNDIWMQMEEQFMEQMESAIEEDNETKTLH